MSELAECANRELYTFLYKSFALLALHSVCANTLYARYSCFYPIQHRLCPHSDRLAGSARNLLSRVQLACSDRIDLSLQHLVDKTKSLGQLPFKHTSWLVSFFYASHNRIDLTQQTVDRFDEQTGEYRC